MRKLVRLFCFATLLLNFSVIYGYCQNVYPVCNKRVGELEAVQSQSGAFVVALMNTDSIPFGTHCYITIYRSTNNGVSWDSVTYIPNPNGGYLADPAMTIDSSGVISLIFMSNPSKDKSYHKIIANPSKVDSGYAETHLHLYRSTDEGLSWQYIGEPYSGINMADYPKIMSSGSGKLELTYTLYTPDSFVNFVSSSDGGVTWSTPVTFTSPQGSTIYQSVGCDLGITGNNAFCLAFGDYNYDSIYFAISTDSGTIWSTLDTIPGIITWTVNKVISQKGMIPIGILSHQPHTLWNPLYFSVSNNQGATWITSVLSDSASYAQGFIDTYGIFHVIYNKLELPEFKLMYTYSDDGGITFREPVALFSGTEDVTGWTGEYQSLILAQDHMFHLTFIDLSDSARTKQIIFAPVLDGIRNGLVEDKMPRIFPNPTQDVLNIEIPAGSTFTRYEISDIKGTVIQSNDLSAGRLQIDLSKQENGMLFLKLISPTRTVICKISKW